VKTIVSQIAIMEDYTNFYLPKNTKYLQDGRLGKYVLWKNSDIVSLLKKHFDPKVLKAYDSVLGNAIKADLARYCILYVFGGWYFDLLMTVDGTINNRIEDFDALVFRDIPAEGNKVSFPISNSIIWVKESKNQIIKNTIDESVSNILNKNYPEHSHMISGPYVFGRNIAKYCIENKDANILIGDLIFSLDSGNAEFVIADWAERKNIHFAWHRLPGLEAELPENYQKKSRYVELFNKKELYL
jgi:hypothetical protein